jgi:FkbM family methyltransferase
MSPYGKRHRLRGLGLRVLNSVARGRSFVYSLASGDEFVLHVGNSLSELVFMGRSYEPHESDFCRRFLARGDTAWDVGANVGYFTALMSRAVGTAGLVVAVEPGVGTGQLLAVTIERLRLANVRVLPVALWHEAAVLGFQTSTSGGDAQQSVARRDKHGSGVVTLPVPALSFADVTSSDWFGQHPAPALIKIDVEGAEPQVVAGMAAHLKDSAAPPALLIECNVEALHAVGNDAALLLAELGRSFELHATPLCWPPWHTGDSGFRPLDPKAPLDAGTELNLVAVPLRGPHRERALRALR